MIRLLVLIIPLVQCKRRESGHVQKKDANKKYIKIVDEIVRVADSAGKSFMARDQVSYSRAMDKANELFGKAVDLDPDDPDAYIAMGTLYLNANELDRSIRMWKGASRCAKGLDNQKLTNYINDRLRYTEYGRVSMERDRVYQGGDGDLIETQRLIEEQLKIFPDHPINYFDLGKLYVNLSPGDTQKVGKAKDALFKAESLAVQACGKAHELIYKQACTNGSYSVVSQWSTTPIDDFVVSRSISNGTVDKYELTHLEYAPVIEDFVENKNTWECRHPDGYVMEFKNALVAGDDAIIIDSKNCRLFIQHSPFVAIDANVPILETWYSDDTSLHKIYSQRGFPPSPPPEVKKLKDVILLAGYQSNNFYHLVNEVLARIVAILPSLQNEPPDMIILPTTRFKEVKQVIKNSVSILKNTKFMKWKSALPPGVRVEVERLRVPSWETPELSGAGDILTHTLTPPNLLRGIRPLLAKAFDKQEIDLKNDAKFLHAVYVSRDNAETRSFDGTGLSTHLKEVCEQEDYGFKIHGGDNHKKLSKEYDTFSRTAVLIGVHGAGLANMVMMRPGTTIIELESPLFYHYRHAAAALGMQYHFVHMDHHERGAAVKDIHFFTDRDWIQVVGDIVRKALRRVPYPTPFIPEASTIPSEEHFSDFENHPKEKYSTNNKDEL